MVEFGKWVWSYSDESYSEPFFDTRAGAIAAAEAEIAEDVGQGGQKYYFTACTREPEIAGCMPDAEFIEEHISETAGEHEDGGEWSEGLEFSEAAKTELNFLLRAWMARHFKPHWFCVEQVEERSAGAGP